MKQITSILKSMLLAVTAFAVYTPAYAQLSGTYTVGGATPDYATLVAAINDLNSQGVSGPVTFNIRTGTYVGQVSINNIIGASAANRITIQSETGNPASVIVRFGPGSSNNYIIRLNNASYVTIKNISVTTTTSNYGRLIYFVSNASYNEVDNCILDAGGTSSNMACVYGTSLKGTNNTIKNNTMTGGYYGVYFSGSSSSYANSTKNTVIENNTYNNIYYYSNYLYYQNNLKFRNNSITKTQSGTHYGARIYYCDSKLEFTGNTINFDGSGTRYGLYAYYNDGGMIIKNNKITIVNTGTKYGMRLYYNYGTSTNRNMVMNNAIAIDNSTSTAYGLFNYYSKYQLTVNNSINVKSTSATSVAARFYFSSSTYGNNDVLNNAFSNETGSGYTLYLYNGNQSYNNIWDYNNIYNGTNKLVETTSPSATYTTMAAWRTAYNQDMHTISYDPGFTSTTDLRPDVNDPACWSLNGRALHIAGNNVDINNNTRVQNPLDGVPDIGAYEFLPETVPPLATATPSSADPGDIQVFTFGQLEVGQIKWGIYGAVPQIEVRQYSGEKGAGVEAAASPFGSMYFHTDITPMGTATSYDFDLNIDYMDIWMGTVANENDLRMAQRVPTYNWMIYNDILSSSNSGTNDIDAPSLTHFGSFTGLENGSIQSAFIKLQSKTTICIGDHVLLSAEPVTGDAYKWKLNGTEIIGANGTTYNASQGGSYSVEITYAGKRVESVPVMINTIAPPNAVIQASGNLTYCTGNGLVLNAGSTPGVTYQWQLNGVNIPGATGKTYSVAQAGKYTVQVENTGCASISVPTSIQAGPLTIDLGRDTSYCEIKNVFAKLDAGYPGARYLWSTGDTTQTIEVKKSGKYTVHVDAGANCVDDDDIIVNIDPLPKAAGISFVRNGNTYQFFASGPVNVKGLMWIFSDGTTSTQNNPFKTIDGDLYVRMVMYNGCGTDTMQLGWPLSVQETGTNNTVLAYPNPATDRINVKVIGVSLIDKVYIINALGCLVSSADAVNAKHYTQNVADLPAGNYIIRIATGDGVLNKPFVITR